MCAGNSRMNDHALEIHIIYTYIIFISSDFHAGKYLKQLAWLRLGSINFSFQIYNWLIQVEDLK